MSATEVKLEDDRKIRMVSGPSIVSNPIETATIRKLRIRLLPFLFALYVVAFIDRINLGFAALTMNRELAITSQQFGFAAGIFFWGYFLFEIPSNLILHKIGARVWIARILITWGAVATLTGFVQSANQLYIARFALGLAEAGYFPGIVLYLGYWFRQREKAQAIALILMGIPLASVLGAPISGFILDHARWFGLSSWRWLLILEGLPAVTCVFLTNLLLPSRPAEARFLTKEEKAWIADQLEREDRQKLGAHSTSVARTLVGWVCCYDPQSPWPDRDDPRVSSLRPQAGAAIPHRSLGCLSWNCVAAAWSASVSLLLHCSFFSRGHRGIQPFARFLFGARRIPDRLLGSCWYCPCDIGR